MTVIKQRKTPAGLLTLDGDSVKCHELLPGPTGIARLVVHRGNLVGQRIVASHTGESVPRLAASRGRVTMNG